MSEYTVQKVTFGGTNWHTCSKVDCVIWGNETDVLRHINKNVHKTLDDVPNTGSYSGRGLSDYGMAEACVNAKRKIRKMNFLKSIGGEEKLVDNILHAYFNELKLLNVNFNRKTIYALLSYFGFSMFRKFDDVLVAVKAVNEFGKMHNIKERQAKEVLRSLIIKARMNTSDKYDGDFKTEMCYLFEGHAFKGYAREF